jgi:hypothetical protein
VRRSKVGLADAVLAGRVLEHFLGLAEVDVRGRRRHLGQLESEQFRGDSRPLAQAKIRSPGAENADRGAAHARTRARARVR